MRVLTAILVIGTLGTLMSCTRENLDGPGNPVIDDRISFLRDLGFVTADIIRVDSGYVIDGDIFLTNQDVDLLMQKQARVGTSFLISPQNQTNIKVWADNLESGWNTALTQAIAEWNASPNSTINFTTGSSGNYNIRVRMVPSLSPTTTIANALLPSAGNAGSLIQINALQNWRPISSKKLILMHELGHTIGFVHTDTWNSELLSYKPTFVNGTASASDYGSLMNSAFNAVTATITLYDRYLLSLTYPEYPPLTGTHAIYRYHNHNNNDHFYTQNWSELAGDVNPYSSGYTYESIAYYAGAVQFGGMVPFYRYEHSVNHRHFYTINPSEVTNSGQPYSYQGSVGYVFPTQQPGTFPLYRYRNTISGDHLYTINWGELGSGAYSYTYQGIACYVYPPPF